MSGFRPTRFVRPYYRAALIWAAMPLAAFNGHTIVGCGCTGHFEPVCHCYCCLDSQDNAKEHCGTAGCPCCSGHRAKHGHCPCCDQNRLARSNGTPDQRSRPDNGQGVQNHRCRPMVLYEVTPVTVVQSVDAGDLLGAVLALAIIDRPSPVNPAQAGEFVDFDTGPPPNDLVVSFHRLVI